MADLNKVILAGRLGKEPEFKDINGRAMVKLSVATSERWQGRDGKANDSTEWHTVILWGPQAEQIMADGAQKGDLVYVDGKITTRKWEDKSGQTRYMTEIQAFWVRTFPKGQHAGHAAPTKPTRSLPPAGGDDEIPF